VSASHEADHTLVVGISGMSGTGKTTFARALCQQLEDLTPVLLHQDRYFTDWSTYPPHERERLRTANRPDAVNWDALATHLSSLRQGQAVTDPAPGTGAFARGEPSRTIEPSAVILVEGHLLFWDARVRELCELKLFLETEPDERVLRRVVRDVLERGRPLEQVVAWYRRDVLPNYPTYTAPTRRYADLIIPHDVHNPRAVEVVAAGIRALLAVRRTAPRP
jgi:uridine kinase